MKKRKFSLLFFLGACLVLISLSLMLVFRFRLHMGARQSRIIASKIDALLPERTAGAYGMYPGSAMPVLEIDHADYVAMVEIPSFGLTLPVADKWDSNRLSLSPARFYGSVYDGSLIIGGIDDSRQFGFCGQIEHGALITVTDMTGAQFAYAVSRVDRAKHAEAQWLSDGDCDLTLFCHDSYSMEYIAVRCVSAFS